MNRNIIASGWTEGLIATGGSWYLPEAGCEKNNSASKEDCLEGKQAARSSTNRSPLTGLKPRPPALRPKCLHPHVVFLICVLESHPCLTQSIGNHSCMTLAAENGMPWTLSLTLRNAPFSGPLGDYQSHNATTSSGQLVCVNLTESGISQCKPSFPICFDLQETQS